MTDTLIHPEVIERQVSLFAWEAKALNEGRLRRILRPYGQSEALDRIIVYTYGPYRLTLTKPWRNHWSRIGGEGDGTAQPLTLEQVQEAGLADEAAFLEWQTQFGAYEWCWLATFDVTLEK